MGNLKNHYWDEILEKGMQTWTVKISVDNVWVADGFNLTKERLEEMLLKDLSFAYEHEVKGEIVKAPDPATINRIQGYL